MRNEYLLICDNCGRLATDYLNEDTKYICPLCNYQMREITELTSDNYNNFIYKEGVKRYRVEERRMAVRRNLMKDYKKYDEKTLNKLEIEYRGRTPSESQIYTSINITDPEIKKIYERTSKEEEEQIGKIMEAYKQGLLNPNVKKKEPARHCPICNSINVKPISMTSRAVHGAAFGLFSKTARSQFECKNCGYKF